MSRAHLPALIVVVPLIAALLAPILRRAAWLLALFATLAATGIAVLLLLQVQAEGVVSYALGGWPPPFGIEYRVDALNAFVLLIVSGIAAVVTPYARASVAREVPADRRHFFYAAYLLCVTGLLGIVITGDAFNLYVLLEVSSLATYVLVALGDSRRSLTASFNYLVLGTIGATLILIGIGHLYMMTGTLNMLDLRERLAPLQASPTVRTGFAFILAGAGLKLALFPLHAWLPNAYTHAPSAVSALLAATSTKVGAYVVLRFVYTVFGIDFSFLLLDADEVLVTLGGIAVVVGSLIATRQSNVKRLLAYSSIAQIGYFVLGFGMATVTGLSAGLIHVFNHALMKGALFLALGCVAYRVGSVELDDLRGLGRRMPWTFGAFVLGGLSLIGIPGTAGFISKWYLLLGALEQGWWVVTAVIVAGSLLAVVYVWRVVEAAYFHAPARRGVREAPLSMLAPTWLLILANVYFGLDASLTTDLAGAAARWLLDGSGA